MKSWSIAIILVIATVGLLLSNTEVVSVFKGSHYVTDISGDGNDVNCSACHKHVAEEMAITRALHGPHWDLSCEDCHRFNGSGITFATANSSGAFPGKQAHAAYVPSCLDCHGGNGVDIINVTGTLVHAPPARAFNVTTKVNGRNVTVISSIPYATAHKQFVAYCENMGDENLACLACHTNYSVSIAYEYNYSLSYTLVGWSFYSFIPSGLRQFEVNVTKRSVFSGKHEFIPIKPVCKINCSKCHLNIYLGLINGKHAPIYSAWGSTNLWGLPRYHLSSPSKINNSYCYECHDLYIYAKLDPSANTTYDLSDAVPFTNSTEVHCAEKVSCLTCHGYGKPYDLLSGYLNGSISPKTRGPRFDLFGHEDLINSTASKPRMFHGDVCMGCHMASLHGPPRCSYCHAKGSVSVYIESEPSGYAQNAR